MSERARRAYSDVKSVGQDESRRSKIAVVAVEVQPGPVMIGWVVHAKRVEEGVALSAGMNRGVGDDVVGCRGAGRSTSA